MEPQKINQVTCPKKRISRLPPPIQALPAPHVIVIGLQEVDLTAAGLIKQDTGKSEIWRDAFSQAISDVYTSEKYLSDLTDKNEQAQKVFDRWQNDATLSLDNKSGNWSTATSLPLSLDESYTNDQFSATYVQKQIWIQKRWIDQQKQHLSTNPFICIQNKQYVGISTILFARREIVPFIGCLDTSILGTGFMGTMGNKGGIGISLQLEWKNEKHDTSETERHKAENNSLLRPHNNHSKSGKTNLSSNPKTKQASLCFLVVHLAAGSKQVKRRHQDFQHLMNELRFRNPNFQPPIGHKSLPPTLTHRSHNSPFLWDQQQAPSLFSDPSTRNVVFSEKAERQKQETRPNPKNSPLQLNSSAIPDIDTSFTQKLDSSHRDFERAKSDFEARPRGPTLAFSDPVPPLPNPVADRGETDKWKQSPENVKYEEKERMDKDRLEPVPIHDEIPTNRWTEVGGEPIEAGQRKVNEHDVVIVAGDLNFRIVAPLEEVHAVLKVLRKEGEEEMSEKGIGREGEHRNEWIQYHT
ncbi:hypothetical protein BLNAU_5068 [Blattamonas nauphoetae]|uniref:Inositol polyphosphate-related phosphatase domain-containing protein n=1 Tax=Blattamonas nauphoetae TaxID=2049346 RepID=A0ABQ9Y831_9EUKA|nr:hypothetical protein BLNAU_5068 [Blattamonas nauphoetae]